MAAFDINSPSAALGFGIGKLGSPMDVLSSGIFDSRPIVCDWTYIMFCEYMDCMFRSEWLKDPKFKSLVIVSDTDSDTDNESAVRMSFSTSGSQCMAMITAVGLSNK